ncbi:MAG TPA: carboxypeptidase-like regulatory domain-containing protein [Gemmatimonadaceae bacterium]|nr:carboxypeptidase-like regulatory domain-containing protein [Gemmatimonadaceae bacterium]
MPRRSLIVGLLILCAGCVPIPHRHVKRPAVVFRVRDPSHRPIPGAVVRLVRCQSTTDSAGIVRITRVSEWRPFYPLIGEPERPPFWAWRVDAPGFQPDSGVLRGEPQDTVEVHLEAGEHVPRPAVTHVPCDA